MNQKEMDRILNQIAKSHQTTPQIIRKEMEFALVEAQKSTDPATQAKWAAIPRKGEKVTLEEFLEYTVDSITKLRS